MVHALLVYVSRGLSTYRDNSHDLCHVSKCPCSAFSQGCASVDCTNVSLIARISVYCGGVLPESLPTMRGLPTLERICLEVQPWDILLQR